MKREVIAADIGNTSLHLRTSGGGAAKFRSAVDGQIALAAEWIAEHCRGSTGGLPGADDSDTIELRIASVNGPYLNALRNELATESGIQFDIRVLDHRQIPLPVRIPDVDALGIDRLIAAAAASRLCGPSCVVIDSGSAITVDWVDRGDFAGGAILPGLAMQSRILAGGTDRLFEIEFKANDNSADEDDVDLSLPPGIDTASAIAAGITTSVVAGLDRIIERYFELAGETIPVVGTGGDVEFLHRRLSHPVRLEPDLVCDAILRLDLP